MASEDGPAQPKSILRGHKSQVHTAAFVRRNERLMTGDADGFVIAWDLTIMRPRAVWKAHSNSILGISGWGVDKVITHGRDNKLIVWKLGVDDEARMSTTLPLDPSSESRSEPWMLHMLEVNTMNFCSFSYCPVSEAPDSEILLAVPNTLASEAIDIYHLPSQDRRYTVKLGDKNGMVMALSISANGPHLTLIAGYENGIAIVAQFSPDTAQWMVKYQSKSHSQPILSLDISPDKKFFITSGADAVIAKHPLPVLGQPDATPDLSVQKTTENISKKETKALLSTVLQPESSSVKQPTLRASSNSQVQTEALKIVNTKHSGQQSLRIRSDGRVFATAGWDNKVRVYSTKTLKELAVLKWHQAGCYAVAFAEIDPPQDLDKAVSAATREKNDQAKEEETSTLTIIPKLVELTVRDKRIKEAKSAHWLAAGSKDTKVSLWAVF